MAYATNVRVTLVVLFVRAKQPVLLVSPFMWTKPKCGYFATYKFHTTLFGLRLYGAGRQGDNL